MRDINRIEQITYELGKLWIKHPDYRFGQLLINYGIIPDSFPVWRREDDELLAALREMNKNEKI